MMVKRPLRWMHTMWRFKHSKPGRDCHFLAYLTFQMKKHLWCLMHQLFAKAFWFPQGRHLSHTLMGFPKSPINNSIFRPCAHSLGRPRGQRKLRASNFCERCSGPEGFGVEWSGGVEMWANSISAQIAKSSTRRRRKNGRGSNNAY